MANQPPAKASRPRPGTSLTVERDRLAQWVLALSGVGIVLISLFALVLATDRAEMARLVFTSVLPLLGTWVGTVLAFYFARENLRTATANTAQLLGLNANAHLVADAMLPRARMVVASVPAGATIDDVKLVDIYNRITSAGVMRLPILDNSDVVHYIVHKSTLDAFAAARKIDPLAFGDLTMQTLSSDPELGKLVKSMGFIGPKALLSDAQREIREISNCNDVFVTTSGKNSDPVIGWLTNTDLAGQA